MSFPARVFRILIASPSDVTEERDIAVKVIQEWNDLNAAERQLVILPLRWETHSAPEYGKRPQEVINRQVVDSCDLLVGIFWTRVGSPTGAAESGTLEEIERVATRGCPVMLYFSQAKQDPDKIDMDQLAKLRDFKKKTFPRALIETYSGPVEFRDKLAKQIEIQLRSLLVEQSGGEKEDTAVRPITDIVLHYSDSETGRDLGSEIEVETTFTTIVDFDKIPDYAPKKTQNALLSDEHLGQFATAAGWTAIWENPDKEFYRRQAIYWLRKAYCKPIRFWLKNKGGIGARDVYIDLNFKATMGNVLLTTNADFLTPPPSLYDTTYFLGSTSPPLIKKWVIPEGSNSWKAQLEVNALQPQREISPPSNLLIGAGESCQVLLSARIYADTLPQPMLQELKISLKVTGLSHFSG